MAVFGKSVSATGLKAVIASLGLLIFVIGAQAQDVSPTGVRHIDETALLTGSTWPTIFDDEAVVEFNVNWDVSFYGNITNVEFVSRSGSSGVFVSRTVEHSFDSFEVKTTYKCETVSSGKLCSTAPQFSQLILITTDILTLLVTLSADYSLPVIQDLGSIEPFALGLFLEAKVWPEDTDTAVEVTWLYDVPYNPSTVSTNGYEVEASIQNGSYHGTLGALQHIGQTIITTTSISCIELASGGCVGGGPAIGGRIYHSNNQGEASVVTLNGAFSDGSVPLVLTAATIPDKYTNTAPITATISSSADLSSPPDASGLLLTNAENAVVIGNNASSFDVVITPLGSGPIGLFIPSNNGLQ